MTKMEENKNRVKYKILFLFNASNQIYLFCLHNIKINN